MKRFTLIIIGTFFAANFLIAGGLVTNTNQSAAWSRMLSRGATLELDGVYYNPAGLTKLGDGFHISLSGQSIYQTQTITNSFPYLNDPEYTGKISAPIFPSVYLAYKTGKWAFSLGFMPIGGGGGAAFDRGVPLMEMPVASLVPAFADLGVTGYSVNMNFEGTSVYWGIQGGVSFAITENISVFGGARYVMAKNTYTGYLKDITLQTSSGDIRADDFMNGLATQAEGAATIATGLGNGMQPIMDAGYGSLSWAEAVQYGVLDATQAAQLQGGLMQFGFSEAEVAAMDMQTAQGSYYGTAVALDTQAAELQGGASLMGDQEGDITQTGSGITPIIGANFSFLEDNFNLGIRYEFKTKLDLTNEVPAGKGFVIGMNPDGTPIEMFPDGEVTNADIPAMLSVGLDFKIADPVLVSLTYHQYFDKNTGWAEEANPNEIDGNFWEMGAGLQYSITDNFLLSAGYLRAESGVNQYYQSNLSYSLSSNTFAFGGAYRFNDTFKLNLGGYYVMYDEKTYNYDYEMMGGGATIPYSETYDKSTFAFALGLDISIHSKKDK